jgi:hypothetical protein
MQKGRVKPGLFNGLDYVALVFPVLAGQGRKPIIRAPMKANAAQIINALIGLVSPMT